jgi:hypothetical protein
MASPVGAVSVVPVELPQAVRVVVRVKLAARTKSFHFIDVIYPHIDFGGYLSQDLPRPDVLS